MHVETYPAFLTPRDKEPSLSSSEEKSSEFGWLERKRKWKWKRRKKYRASVDPAFRSLECVSHSMASSIFIIWKIDFYWLFENDLESPLIFVLFLKGKQNKKEKP